MTLPILNFPLIKVKHLQTQENSYGWLYNDHLVIIKTHHWEIWNKYGMTLLRNMVEREDAVEIAKILDDAFSEYFVLWDEYPQADVFRMSMWGVENGLKLYETIEKLRISINITLETFNQFYRQSTGDKYYNEYVNRKRYSVKN